MGVATTTKTTMVKLACGGTAYVRRASRSDLSDLATAAGLTMDVCSQVRMAELSCRFALVGTDNLADMEEDGASVEFTTERHSLLGLIATRAVYNALTSEDVDAIIAVSGGKSATAESQEKK